MRVVLFIPTAAVEGEKTSAWFADRLDAAIQEYRAHANDECVFVVAGRWKNVTDTYLFTEAEIGRRYILAVLPQAKVIKEETSVETGGNFAFSKPIIKKLAPDKVCIFNSRVNAARIEFFAQKIFGKEFIIEFRYVDDIFSQNERAQRKEPKALSMFQKLFSDVRDGDDATAREILLQRTPFYHKGTIVDREFFEHYWPGGYDDFLEKRLSIDNQ